MITTEQALEQVRTERKYQDRKWGYPQNNTPFEWISILLEEVGELAEAMNNALLGPCANGKMIDAIEEAVQVAAVATSIVEHLTEEDV